MEAEEHRDTSPPPHTLFLQSAFTLMAWLRVSSLHLDKWIGEML